MSQKLQGRHLSYLSSEYLPNPYTLKKLVIGLLQTVVANCIQTGVLRGRHFSKLGAIFLGDAKEFTDASKLRNVDHISQHEQILCQHSLAKLQWSPCRSQGLVGPPVASHVLDLP